MAQFKIYAMPCEITPMGLSYMVFDKPIREDRVACRTCADIERALEAMRAAIAPTMPGQFFVSAMLIAGERAPAGYRARPYWRLLEARQSAAEAA